jgi:iron uptake system EfeUOB component EfeO/EfeM
MSLKHVKHYYLQCQEQYFDMLNDAKDFDEALKKGLVDQEQFDQAQVLLNKIKENYERLSYIMYLFVQPNRPNKVAKFNKQNNCWGKFN